MISKTKKECLCKFHDNTCEQCNKQFLLSELQIHRIIRQGNYNDHRILKVLCVDCHKLIHGNEFRNCQGK